MIKLRRGPKPDVLTHNEVNWLNELMAAILTYGEFSKIPKEIKGKLLSHYRHSEIKLPLFESSHQKCAFCESKPGESGNIEVEHFIPKSKYPEFTFDWENFLPACRKCNESKDDHDTLSDPIINPYDVDPSTIYYYRDIKIYSNDNNYKTNADLTIKVCGLNSARLMKPRADILINLHTFSETLEAALEDYEQAVTEKKKAHRRRKIIEAIEVIEAFAQPSEKYSSFCKHYLDNCESYQMAKKLTLQQ